MQHTPEQKIILDYVEKTKDKETFIKINSVAGSGKTFILSEIAKQLNPASGLYLAYNTAIALEAQNKFSSNVECSTVHAYAFNFIVKPEDLQIYELTIDKIDKNLHLEYKNYIIKVFKMFCLSEYVSIKNFIEERNIEKKVEEYIEKVYNKMHRKEIPCTHEFYLKELHIQLLLEKKVFPEYDLLMLDEGGDINPVTLEIFLLLEAKHKVIVGDQYQNIYTFNNTINCFEKLKHMGVEFFLTKSFRTSIFLAKRIEAFCKSNFPSFSQFKGFRYGDTDIKTTAYLTRNNIEVIKKTIELEYSKKEYKIIGRTQRVFELINILIRLNSHYKIRSERYAYLQDYVTEYYNRPDLHNKYKTVLMYLAKIMAKNQKMISTIFLIFEIGSVAIKKAYRRLLYYERTKDVTDFYIGTTHSAKGLEFDKVIISKELNETVKKSIEKKTDASLSELNLYYVACTRAKKVLENAVHLKER